MLHHLISMICFLLMVIIQALVINGIHECFKGACIEDYVTKKVSCNGNIFYKMAPQFFEKHKNKAWTMPLWGCIKCMSSFYSFITFWPVVIYLYGFHFVEIPVYVANSFALLYMNYFIYKRQ